MNQGTGGVSQLPKPREPLWTDSDIVRLMDYADRGFRTWEAAKCMNRTQRAVEGIARRYGIRFHGPKGAPKGNQNRKLGELRKQLRQEVDATDHSYGNLISEPVRNTESNKRVSRTL